MSIYPTQQVRQYTLLLSVVLILSVVISHSCLCKDYSESRMPLNSNFSHFFIVLGSRGILRYYTLKIHHAHELFVYLQRNTVHNFEILQFLCECGYNYCINHYVSFGELERHTKDKHFNVDRDKKCRVTLENPTVIKNGSVGCLSIFSPLVSILPKFESISRDQIELFYAGKKVVLCGPYGKLRIVYATLSWHEKNISESENANEKRLKEALIIGRNITNKKAISDDLLGCWDSLSNEHNVLYSASMENGYSQYLSPECIEIATVYANHIVELFEKKRVPFSFKSSRKYYQRRSILLFGHKREKNYSRIVLLQKVQNNGTPVQLASYLGSYIAMQWYIMFEHETEYNQELSWKELKKTGKPDKSSKQDVAHKSDLLKMFALTPEPSFKFRFISIKPTGLKAFTTCFKKIFLAFNHNQGMLFRVVDFSKPNLKIYSVIK
ncbi:C2H2-type zinc finger transcription factor [Phycomyces blakesleeanus NRRL 1555(-)]|uniref:C2H2-type zinc finger transcription factor n=1 Tax=Phycomyces blakesleeanus (strain ATCC 8743b / DSM 1359 / FGSC 10004 / NBRC 33097 / NRRL 1555) TaxID=763407 RepID=A0A167PVQ7_PHYB8|nr:C2H2-type zinc finger transcription factor [Phycomyces blakesleeanus NRRL 1555(-)]OAD78624.1 C2H2-type zinc finger transcription factor [Phycomyces blakesleeanus NRRL 1555(-)]|eukprot:XP_018296664.1 C2H2-type zinc finger transcription factor [Phycomyces blakesleeanus NRRL 1555(-)]